MKKIVSILLLVCTVLSLCFVACGHEHTWNEPTYDLPKTCSGCDETQGKSIKEMLKGEWKNDDSNTYLWVEFTDTGFSADMVVLGKKSGGYFAHKGSVILEGDVITLYEDDGDKYIYYTFEIIDDIIKLFDNDGEEWIKI